MIIYLEIFDKSELNALPSTTDLQVIRVKVSSEEEARKLCDQLKNVFNNPVCFVHYCYHDEKDPKRCKRVVIE